MRRRSSNSWISITAGELDRIREDRHLCVHPAVRRSGSAYDPQPEVARAHIAVALEAVLVHPPTQGRKLIEAFTAYAADPVFVPAPAHVIATFYDRVQLTTRRNIVRLAVKHALLELPGPDGLTELELAARMSECVRAFAATDRAEVHAALLAAQDRFRLIENDKLLRAVARLGDIPELWEIIDGPLTERIGQLVDGLGSPADTREVWASPVAPAVISLVAFSHARDHLAALLAVFGGLSVWQRHHVMAQRPKPYFAEFVPALLRDAGSFRTAETMTEGTVVPHGPYLTAELLQESLSHWAGNNQCRIASRMPDLAVSLYRSTAHLRAVDEPIWRQFLTDVRAATSDADLDKYYQYTQLEEVLPS